MKNLSTDQIYGVNGIEKLEALQRIYYDKSYPREVRDQAAKGMEKLKQELKQWIDSF